MRRMQFFSSGREAYWYNGKSSPIKVEDLVALVFPEDSRYDISSAGMHASGGWR